MKKILFILISLFVLSPLSVMADGIDNFYMEATILDNGDIKIKEAFVLNGSFNGFERIINYENSSTPPFNPNSEYYGGSSIHNGSGIEIINIGAIDLYNNYDFNLLNKEVDYFKYNILAEIGDYGYYYADDTYNGINIRIYNPSSKKKAFYVEYILKDMAIKHNDVGELGLNIFDELREYVGNFEMYINIPNNQNEMRVWAHGPLNGISKILSKNKVYVHIDNLKAYADIDVRLAFDTNVIKNSEKTTNVNALDKILYYEQNQADIANKEREEMQKILLKEAENRVEIAEKNPTRDNYEKARSFLQNNIDGGVEYDKLFQRLSVVYDKVLERENLIKTIYYFGYVIWFIGFICLIKYIYNKYDKEYKADFDGKYFRDFPNEYGPEIVQYLFEYKIDSKGLSAAILNLIANKVIGVESNGDKHTLIYNQAPRELKMSDQLLLNWLFVKIGNNNRVELDAIKNEAREYDTFLDNYNRWVEEAKKEAFNYKLYEKTGLKPLLLLLYSFGGTAVSFIMLDNMVSTSFMVLFVLALFIDIICLIYVITIKKKN